MVRSVIPVSSGRERLIRLLTQSSSPHQCQNLILPKHAGKFLKLQVKADNYCGDMFLDRCCKQRNSSSHSPVSNRFKLYRRQRNNNQKPKPYVSHIKMVCKAPNLFMDMVRHHGSCHIWPLNLFEDWGFS